VKAVLDTNVVVSAAITVHGVCARIVDLLADGVFGVYVDDRILDEYASVLGRPELKIVPEDAAVVLELIRSVAERVTALPLSVDLPDPTDLPFLEVAEATRACLVTGNVRHFPKRVCEHVTVVRPREFLDVLRQAT